MSKKIADLNLDDSEFLNNSLTDFYNDDIDPLEEDTSIENTKEDKITEPVVNNNLDDLYTEEDIDDKEDEIINIPDKSTTPDDNEDISDRLEDYNTLALLALSLKEEDPDLIDFEIEKDIKPEVLITNLKTKFSKTREDVAKEVEEAYGEAAKYLNLILEGASQEDISTALSYNQIASLEITGDEDESILEQVVLSWLNLKGTPDAKDLLEVYKDKGILKEKAKEGVEYHKEQESAFFENWKETRAAQIAQAQKAQLDYQKAVKNEINKGVVKGLTIKDKKKFEDSLFKPTEIIEVIDNTGKKRLQKVPLIQVKMQEFQQDVEQQLAMQLLLLDGFDFTSLVDKAKRKVSNNLINALNERTSTQSVSGRKSSSTYFED
jgi:hypothetical protein